MTTTTTDPLSGFAALGPGEIRDARRRRPGADLSGYAAARGLEALGSASVPGYLAAMPGDEALQFNVLRGTLPGGTHGIVFHHRHAWPVDAHGRAAGTFYGTYYASGGSFKDMLRPDPWAVLSGVPYVGWLFDLARPPRASGDGRRQAVGVPCTVAAALVPEAAACTDFSIDNRAKPAFVAGHRERLGSLDLRGWDLTAAVAPEPRLVQRLLSGPLLARLRAAAELPYFRLELSHGTVVVETNGYLDDRRRLDWLAGTLSIAAAEVRDACRGLADERPFADALPPGAAYAVHDGVPAVSDRRVSAPGNPLGDVPGLIESALRIQQRLADEN